MSGLGSTISYVLFAIWVVSVVVGLYAVVHAARMRKDAFPAVDRLTKPAWLGILIAGTVAMFAFSAGSILWIVGLVAALVYMVDVRPRLDTVTGRR